YYMARLVGPLLDAGYFDSISIERNRLYSQLLDNLNKAAVVGFPIDEIAGRLKGAWLGESAQARVYDEAQECAARFRAYCLAHNLLDFSLQYDLFVRRLWPLPACRDYLTRRYSHLIADNVEEDTPVAHDLLAEWLPGCRSALIVLDREAGYRRFLGADPADAYRFKELCQERVVFTESFVTTAAVAAFGGRLARALGRRGTQESGVRGQRSGALRGTQGVSEELSFDAFPGGASPSSSEFLRSSSEFPRSSSEFPGSSSEFPGSSSEFPGVPPSSSQFPALVFASHRYHPELLDWVADEIAGLVHQQGVPPAEIAVLAPFLSGALRFSLQNRLAGRDVPVRSHRPSRALREEPATLCLLTLAALCHPAWGVLPSRFDVAYAFMQAVDDLDLVRAQLLADIAYRVADDQPSLGPFAEIEQPMQERITFLLGGRYEGLRNWLRAHTADGGAQIASRKSQHATRSTQHAVRPALDHFLSRLFGELLSQPGYGFHGNYDAGEVTANVIESARKFRQVMIAPDTTSGNVILSGHRGEKLSSLKKSEESPSRQAETLRSAQSDSGLGREYVQMVHDGVIAAQYVRSWQRQPKDAVLLSPAYTFLMMNRPVAHQFWLDVGSTGWWERLNQPLTHPYVLSRHWPAGALWTDADEYAARQDALYALALGLVRRCRVQIHLGLSEMGEQGNEQRGPLLQAIQRVLREA
ncbi:MAG: hypothetical protein NT169_28040, partial [Chloroflexi bacterium]|nr:hypothetical protein [Chloroflexota bacterium]